MDRMTFARPLVFTIFLSLAALHAAPYSLVGYWAQNCQQIEEPNGTLEIEDNQHVVIKVAFNQIYLISRLKAVSASEYRLYYEDVDLGGDGMDIPWDEASKTHAIAKIKMRNQDSMLFIWEGLKNKTTKQIIELPFYSFEFEEGGMKAVLERCKH